MRARPRSAKVFVEDCGCLHVADVPILPQPQPEPVPLNLPGAGPPVPDPGLSMSVESTWSDGERTTIKVGIAATYPFFGGVRYWLV